jgi:hypothetical protein
VIWESDKQNRSEGSNNDRENTFNEENPLPASKTSFSMEFG